MRGIFLFSHLHLVGEVLLERDNLLIRPLLVEGEEKVKAE